LPEDKPKKPANLAYGVEDSMPLRSFIPLVLQQLIMLSVDLIFPVLIVAAIGGTTELAQSVVSLMMVAMGIGTLMQACHKGPLGSGYFCAQETGAPYFPASVMAVKAGGFPLLFGMTIVAGLSQILMSRVLHKMRVLFPVEITGLIVTMMAVSFINYSIPSFIGLDRNEGVSTAATVGISCLTLAVIIMMHVWGTARMREYSILGGILVGYVISYYTGVLTEVHLSKFADAPFFAFPDMGHVGWSFDSALLAPFLVAAFCSSIKTIANISTCQKVNDVNWRRMDIHTVSKGLFSEGCSSIISGLLGTMGQTTSSGSVGLSVATGATSRRISYGVGTMFILLAFLPKIAALFAIMPKPVMGVILLIEISFVLPTGMQICSSRMLDARKIFVIGLSFAFGMAIEIIPDFYMVLPEWLQPLFKTSMAMASIMAIFLSLIFRIGIDKHRILELEQGTTSSTTVLDFMETSGEIWGARSEVIKRAAFAINEFVESATELGLATGKIKVDVSFEEFNLDVDIYYDGLLMDFPAVRPTETELMEDESAFIRLSGFLMRKYADKMKSKMSNGRCHVQFHFDH